MAISDKKLAANRANARKSKGPITPEGKRTSSLNATRHGRFAKSVLIDGESTKDFKCLFNALRAEFKPQTTSENLFLQKFALGEWLSTRGCTIQAANINHEIRRQAAATAAEDPATRAMLAMRATDNEAFSRYQQRCDRQQYRALEALERAQQRRRAAMDSQEEHCEERADDERPDEECAEEECSNEECGNEECGNEECSDNEQREEAADPDGQPEHQSSACHEKNAERPHQPEETNEPPE